MKSSLGIRFATIALGLLLATLAVVWLGLLWHPW